MAEATKSGERLIKAEEVLKHQKEGDLWLIIDGDVYDATKFVDEHPGGEEVLHDVAGTDATDAFDDIGHSDEAREILSGLKIGKLDGDLPTGISNSDEKGSKGSQQSQVPLFAVTALLLALIALFYAKQ